MPLPDLSVRLLEPSDSIAEITALLHRAFSKLAAMGMRYYASHQDDDVTRRRVSEGECYLALVGSRIVGTIVFVDAAHTKGCPWYDRPEVACMHQLAVEPELQGQRIGSLLLDVAEMRAFETGAGEVALDTSENAHHLIARYSARGYRFIEHVQWSGPNYRSVIMSKTLRQLS